jgi:hypothetical protein
VLVLESLEELSMFALQWLDDHAHRVRSRWIAPGQLGRLAIGLGESMQEVA